MYNSVFFWSLHELRGNWFNGPKKSSRIPMVHQLNFCSISKNASQLGLGPNNQCITICLVKKITGP